MADSNHSPAGLSSLGRRPKYVHKLKVLPSVNGVGSKMISIDMYCSGVFIILMGHHLGFCKNVFPPLESKLLVMCERIGAPLKIVFDVQYTF
jgi:hypothetical protein